MHRAVFAFHFSLNQQCMHKVVDISDLCKLSGLRLHAPDLPVTRTYWPWWSSKTVNGGNVLPLESSIFLAKQVAPTTKIPRTNFMKAISNFCLSSSSLLLLLTIQEVNLQIAMHTLRYLSFLRYLFMLCGIWISVASFCCQMGKTLTKSEIK